MSFAYFAIIGALVCWKWGNWKALKAYYPTIIFLIMGNLAYYYLAQSKLLFEFGGFLKEYPFLILTTIVILYVSTAILFLTFYDRQKTSLGKIFYVLFWVVLYSSMELGSLLTGHYEYRNGWNYLYSVIFNLVMFPILLLHYKKPLLGWLASVVCAYTVMFLFDIPFRIGG